MNKEEMMHELTALDFTSVDLALYLDTHPFDQKALQKYNSNVIQANMLRQKYEQAYGPLCSFRSVASYPWNWMDEPWPYQTDFELAGEEK